MWLAGFGVLWLAHVLFRFRDAWQHIRGHEHEWIASALALGQGFSFDGAHRWLFEATDPSQFYSTAWIEPLYPALLGLCLWLFGEYGKLVILLIQAAAFLGTWAMAYHLARRLYGPAAGVLACGALLFLLDRQVLAYLGNQVLGALMVAGCAILLIEQLERQSLRRSIVLGAALGLTALVHAGTLLFAPVAVVLALTMGSHGRQRRWGPALAVLVSTMVVVAPWALRNYEVFGRAVLVRNGLGQIAYTTNSALAATLDGGPSNNTSSIPPPWTAGNVWAALRTLNTDDGKASALNTYARESIRMKAPPGFAGMNEAERDQVYLQEAKNFMLAHPATTMKLMAGKLLWLLFNDWRLVVVNVLGITGLLIAYADPRVRALGAMAGAYAAPYVVTAPLFYRYRFPMMPLMAVLAGIAMAHLGTRLTQRYRAVAEPL